MLQQLSSSIFSGDALEYLLTINMLPKKLALDDTPPAAAAVAQCRDQKWFILGSGIISLCTLHHENLLEIVPRLAPELLNFKHQNG